MIARTLFLPFLFVPVLLISNEKSAIMGASEKKSFSLYAPKKQIIIHQALSKQNKKAWKVVQKLKKSTLFSLSAPKKNSSMSLVNYIESEINKDFFLQKIDSGTKKIAKGLLTLNFLFHNLTGTLDDNICAAAICISEDNPSIVYEYSCGYNQHNIILKYKDKTKNLIVSANLQELTSAILEQTNIESST